MRENALDHRGFFDSGNDLEHAAKGCGCTAFGCGS